MKIEIPLFLFIIFLIISLAFIILLIYFLETEFCVLDTIAEWMYKIFVERLYGWMLSLSITPRSIIKVSDRDLMLIEKYIDWKKFLSKATDGEIEKIFALRIVPPADMMIEYMNKNETLIDRDVSVFSHCIVTYFQNYSEKETNPLDKYLVSCEKFMEKSKTLLSHDFLSRMAFFPKFAKLVGKNEEILKQVLDSYRNKGIYSTTYFVQNLLSCVSVPKEIFMEYADITVPCFKFVDKKINTWADLRTAGSKDIRLLKRLHE